MKRIYLFVFAALLCGQSLWAQQIPQELIIAIGHTQMDKKGVQVDKLLQEYLTKKLSMPVKVFYPKNIFEMLDKIDSNKVHLVDINPFGYVMASLNGKVDVLAIRGNKDKQVETYNSCILVNAKSPVRKITDLKKFGSKLEMAFVNAASTSGHLVPRLYFNSINLDVETVFKKVEFKGTHINAVNYIKNNPNAIGACAYNFFLEQVAEGKIKKSDFRILWTSPDIPHGPVAVLKNLDPAFKTKLQEAYLAIPTEAPELWKVMLNNWYAKPETTTYIKGSDEAFNSLRKITNEADDLILILNFYRE